MAASESRMSVKCVENGTVEGKSGLISGLCTEFIIVRHGETEWNALGRMQGQSDIDLNEAGRQQAVAVAERLSMEPNICGIYSSDLKRAVDTAETIASRCGGLEVIKDQDLRERHIGELQGVVYHESLSKSHPEAYEALISGQEITGGGESRDHLYKRCVSSLHRIAEKHRGGRVVIVTHGEVIRTLYRRTFNGDPGNIGNTSVSMIQFSEGEKWSIKSWNDNSHLKRTEVLESDFGSGGGSSC